MWLGGVAREDGSASGRYGRGQEGGVTRGCV